MVEVLNGKRILWLDDLVAGNRREWAMFAAFGPKIEQVHSNGAALAGPKAGPRDPFRV